LKNQRLRLILILLVTISLSGCKNIPWPTRDVERCTLFINRVDASDLYEGKCRCHPYRINKTFLGRSGDPTDHPVEYCKRLVGFRPTEWTDFFVPWFEELQIWSGQQDKELQEMINDNIE
jgi:hypothetical protein